MSADRRSDIYAIIATINNAERSTHRKAVDVTEYTAVVTAVIETDVSAEYAAIGMSKWPAITAT